MEPDETGAVNDVVVTERWARDTGQWEAMGRCFHPDSRVEISWISTDGPDFVELSRRAFEGGARSAHLLGQPMTRIEGERATVDVGTTITGMLMLHDEPAVLTAQSRILERLEKRRGTWRISHLTCVYQFDHLAVGRPGTPLTIDAELYESFRPSYAALSYWVSQTRGLDAVRDDLPGLDRPDTVTKIHADATAWLVGGNA